MRSDAEHAAAASRSKAERFHAMLQSPELTFLMEAHNGLSARVVEETGYSLGNWLDVDDAFDLARARNFT